MDDRTVDLRDPVRLGAVDDHPLLLTGLRTGLEGSGVRMVASAPDVPTLLSSGERPDVVLLDLRLGDGSRPRDNVLALVAAGAAVLVYSEGEPQASVDEAVAAGAGGVLRKQASLATLVEGIRALAATGTLVNADMARVLERSQVLRPSLSEREVETMRLYATGMAAKSVARRMGVTEGTTKEYLSRIRRKYEAIDRPANTRMQMYERGLEDGIIAPLGRTGP